DLMKQVRTTWIDDRSITSLSHSHTGPRAPILERGFLSVRVLLQRVLVQGFLGIGNRRAEPSILIGRKDVLLGDLWLDRRLGSVAAQDRQEPETDAAHHYACPAHGFPPTGATKTV